MNIGYMVYYSFVISRKNKQNKHKRLQISSNICPVHSRRSRSRLSTVICPLQIIINFIYLYPLNLAPPPIYSSSCVAYVLVGIMDVRGELSCFFFETEGYTRVPAKERQYCSLRCSGNSPERSVVPVSTSAVSGNRFEWILIFPTTHISFKSYTQSELK